MLSLLAFLLTIGILVVVHEYGHYLFARMFKVKVLVFSIGFGPKILSIHSKANEWRISLIPFGGYVRMLDEREGIVNQNEKHLAFNNKPPYQKILIAMAGPLFNILFAILVYYVIGITGITQVKPVISSINPQIIQNTVKADVITPSQIIAIDGYAPKSWADADKKFNQAIMHKPQFKLQLEQLKQFRQLNQLKSQSIPNIQSINIDSKNLLQHFNRDISLEDLGFYPMDYLPVIAYIEPHSVADKSGLKINDRIIAINSKPVTSWFQVFESIHSSPGIELQLKISRQGQSLDYRITPAGARDDSGQLVGRLGIMPLLDENLLLQNSFVQKYSMIDSLSYAVNECYRIMQLNLSGIYQIITGKLSPYNLGGPITIAKIGGSAIGEGVVHFAEFLALISISLAIMNLLPIPVLDGGHIIIYAIELIFNKQFSYEFQGFIFKLGFIFILGLSLFAIYNDMGRL